MKKIFFLYIFALFFLEAQDPLIIGTASGYAPYVSVDAQGKYEGFDIDFAELLAQKMDRQLVFKDLGSMPSLLLALQQKKIDAVIWAVSITEERCKKMEMIYYQGEKVTQMPFLFWKEIPQAITSIEDLGQNSKYLVSVEAGSWQEGVLKKYPTVRSKQVEKVSDALMEIRYGKSIAAMVDPSLVLKVTSQYPEVKPLFLSLKKEDCSLGNGICLRKDDTTLIEPVQKAVNDLIREGKVRELERKWKIGES